MGDFLGTPDAAGAPATCTLSPKDCFPDEFGELCKGGVKERNCGKNPGSTICEANMDISGLFGRKGVKNDKDPQQLSDCGNEGFQVD